MFVIADTRSKIPAYFWKFDSCGMQLITVELKYAKVFNSRNEAKDTLAGFKPDELFNFSVHELKISK